MRGDDSGVIDVLAAAASLSLFVVVCGRGCGSNDAAVTLFLALQHADALR